MRWESSELLKKLDDDQLQKWVRERMYDPHTETALIEEEVTGMTRGMSNGIAAKESHL